MKYLVHLSVLCLPLLTFSSSEIQAQDAPAPPSKVLEQSNVAYHKRVERIIDMREKQNLVMMSPEAHLPTLMLRGVASGAMRAYPNDSFNNPFADSALSMLGCSLITTSVLDQTIIDEEIEKDTTFLTCDLIEKIVKLRVIKDWVFNRETGRMEVRIVAIAPLYRPVYAGIEFGEVPMFWIRWEEQDTSLMSARRVLENYLVFNRSTDAPAISFTHFFEKRMFSSYITKQSNEFDMRIKDLEEFSDDPMLSLLESERLKNMLFEKEHDLWEY